MLSETFWVEGDYNFVNVILLKFCSFISVYRFCLRTITSWYYLAYIFNGPFHFLFFPSDVTSVAIWCYVCCHLMLCQFCCYLILCLLSSDVLSVAILCFVCCHLMLHVLPSDVMCVVIWCYMCYHLMSCVLSSDVTCVTIWCHVCCHLMLHVLPSDVMCVVIWCFVCCHLMLNLLPSEVMCVVIWCYICYHLMSCVLSIPRQAAPAHCAATGERGYGCQEARGIQKEGVQARGHGPPTGTEDRWQGQQPLPQAEGGKQQGPVPQEEPPCEYHWLIR